MSRRVLVAAFDDERRLLAALAHARRGGHEVLDVHGPYPVHGIDEAMGRRASRLPWACLACGVLGLGSAVLLQAWTSAMDWPLNVGGKPLLSWPAFVPVAFELSVLFAGLGVVAAFFLAERSRRKAPPARTVGRTTDDLFHLSIGARDATWDASALARLYGGRLGAIQVEEVLVEEEP